MTKYELKNITYDLVKMEKALVFQILEQDESWRYAKFFDSTKKRDKYYNKINEALKEWDEMVEKQKKELKDE